MNPDWSSAFMSSMGSPYGGYSGGWAGMQGTPGMSGGMPGWGYPGYYGGFNPWGQSIMSQMMGGGMNPWGSSQTMQGSPPTAPAPGAPGPPTPQAGTSQGGPPAGASMFTNGAGNWSGTPEYVNFMPGDQNTPQQNLLRNWFQKSPYYNQMTSSDMSKYWSDPITRGAEIEGTLEHAGWRPSGTGAGLIAPWAPQGWAPQDSNQAVWASNSGMQARGVQQVPMGGSPTPSPSSAIMSGMPGPSGSNYGYQTGTGAPTGGTPTPPPAYNRYGYSPRPAGAQWY